MRFSEIGALAALGVAANAFMMPTSVSKADTDAINAIPYEAEIDSRVVEVPCPNCPVEVTLASGDTLIAPPGVLSLIRLNFTLSHNEHDQLDLNGVELYPVADGASSFLTKSLTAEQIFRAPDGSVQLADTPELGFSMAVESPATNPEDSLRLVNIRFEIAQVGGKDIYGIPAFDIKLLETPSKNLMIAEAIISSNPGCTSFLCKWRAIIKAKIAAIKNKIQRIKGGCHGKARPHGAGNGSKHGARPHHRVHHHSKFARVIRGIVLHVFIPIMIGVVVGITASLVGMVVGHIAIFLWRTLFRRNTTSYQTVAQEPTDDDDEENKPFTDEPPVYEHAPAYEDVPLDEKTAA